MKTGVDFPALHFRGSVLVVDRPIEKIPHREHIYHEWLAMTSLTQADWNYVRSETHQNPRLTEIDDVHLYNRNRALWAKYDSDYTNHPLILKNKHKGIVTVESLSTWDKSTKGKTKHQTKLEQRA